MMKFEVLLESPSVTKQVTVEADTHEEAVAKAKAMNLTVTVEPRPAWVDTTEKVHKTGELEHEVVGYCDDCMKPIVSRDIPGQPWNYTSASEHGGLLCFVCANGVSR